MNKVKKITSSFATITALMGMTMASMAIEVPDFNPGNGNAGAITGDFDKVLGIVQLVGVLVAVVMVMYVGIKYLTAGAGKKAEAKEVMVPVLIGAVLVALAPTIVRWIFGALS